MQNTAYMQPPPHIGGEPQEIHADDLGPKLAEGWYQVKRPDQSAPAPEAHDNV